MYNWSVDETELKKDKEKYALWKVQQMINWGLGGEKLPEYFVRKNWEKLSMDDPTRRYLKFLLWPSQKQ